MRVEVGPLAGIRPERLRGHRLALTRRDIDGLLLQAREVVADHPVLRPRGHWRLGLIGHSRSDGERLPRHRGLHEDVADVHRRMSHQRHVVPDAVVPDMPAHG